MRPLLAALLLGFLSLGCARIYRPVALAPARVSEPHGGLAATLVPQPWGDNSGYEEKAQRARLRIAVLALENQSGGELSELSLAVPDGAQLLGPEAALRLVKQQPLLFLLYPLVPGLAALGSSNSGSPGSVGPSDRAVFTGVTIIGVAIGLPNAWVAAHSNRRLGAFFAAQAWSPGPLASGEHRRGLVFLVGPDPHQSLGLSLRYRDASGDHSLPLVWPGVAPP